MERARLGCDHFEAGAAMLGQWGFPKPFVDVLSHVLDPEGSGFGDGSRNIVLTRTLNVAMRLSEICVAEEARRGRMLPELYRLAARLTIDEQTLGRLMDAIALEWRKWGELLKVPTRSVPSIGEMRDAHVAGIAPTGVDGAPAPRAGLRVMVIDDDRTLLLLMAKVLGQAGHTVTVAADGVEALHRIGTDRPHLVITDWEMPRMDGLTFCKALRQTSAGRRIYIMIVTGHGDEQRLQEAFLAGADDYVTKPIRPNELLARMRAGQRFIEIQRNLAAESGELRKIAIELAAANKRLNAVAHMDALTGIPNRRFLLERLDQEFAVSVRKGAALTLLLLDVDHFKPINDRFGHPVGDAVLSQLAKELRARSRTGDTVGRLGGEEFLVICPDTSSSAAITAAERLRQAIENLPAIPVAGLPGVTVSVGIAERDATVHRASDLVEKVDQALYQAKQGGRNRCAVFRPAPEKTG
jgi:diguanylate cyclase (GGDEF)-like protein